MFEKVNGYKHCLNLIFYLFSFTLHILFRSHSLCLFTVQFLYTIDFSIARLNIVDRVLRSREKGWRHILADLKVVCPTKPDLEKRVGLGSCLMQSELSLFEHPAKLPYQGRAFYYLIFQVSATELPAKLYLENEHNSESKFCLKL